MKIEADISKCAGVKKEESLLPEDFLFYFPREWWDNSFPHPAWLLFFVVYAREEKNNNNIASEKAMESILSVFWLFLPLKLITWLENVNTEKNIQKWNL